MPGTSSSDNAELIAARRRIAEAETEIGGVTAGRRAVEVGGAPKRRFEAIEVMANEGLPVEIAARICGASILRTYSWRNPGAIGTGHPPRLAHRPDHRDPLDVTAYVWSAA